VLKFEITGTLLNVLWMFLILMVVRFDGWFIWNLMYGCWMFDRVSFVVCRCSISLRCDCIWFDRVLVEKRVMKLFNCAIFFSCCALLDSMSDRICVFVIIMSS